MEKNSTQRKISTVSIFIYGDSQDKGNWSDISFRAGNKTREFTVKHTTFFAAIKEAVNGRDRLFILVDFDRKDSENIKLLSQLDKSGTPYVFMESDNGSLTAQGGDLLSSLDSILALGFTLNDFAQIHQNGIAAAKIRRQLQIFKNGIARTMLKKPALLNDGIVPVSAKCIEEYAAIFDAKKDAFKLMKFVPASGAASRMFKSLCEFLAAFDPETDTINSYINHNKEKGAAISVFLVGMEKFPFYDAVLQKLQCNPDYAGWGRDYQRYMFIKTLLTDKAFDYANKPKGILPFHHYPDFIATPVYEHLKESVSYGASNKQSHLHFTISEEHLDGFLDSISEVKEKIEQQSGVSIAFDFSYQQKSTDTIAVDMNNKPFRDENGKLLFRPGGHGALIENLGRLDADIVFIKNIDNVSHNHINTIAVYKKALAGILIKLQEKVFHYLERLSSDTVTEEEVAGIFVFAEEKLSQRLPADIEKYAFKYKKEYAFQLLNRPIRVCGMVKNEGEPGGGPFWVEEEKGNISLQIVESSQIDMDNKSQERIFAGSTHFNPVDLVCGLKDFKGDYFNLPDFVDANSGFIVHKNRMGKDVKSYELPGLWNGAMAGWITVFAEVPLETFNPVKTVNDLLKPAHQPQ